MRTITLPNTLRGKITYDEMTGKYSTWRIGGKADVMYEPSDVEDVTNLLAYLRAEKIPYFILGKGSNLMFPDEGIRGVVIKMADALTNLTEEGNTVTVGAGYSLVKLAAKMSRNGLSGLEFAAGIPATVGGAVFMNAGAHGGEMADVISRIHVLRPDGTDAWFEGESLQFSYRHSFLQDEELICLEAELTLQSGDSEDISSVLEKNKQYRKDTQPYGEPSCGSVFKNPRPLFAAKLIEDAGLKGKRFGGVKVSEKHANFIVNDQQGTAEDVLNLMVYIQKKIEQTAMVTLEPEVQVVRPDCSTVSAAEALRIFRKH
ncbi:UDP-N-acetylmuramate dehydrogenase [Salisediminibacterium selenitireducens]|uniref:UDP-N-acetylenolpyruvoylglucosamine reductase n=1 Tax=Bacillus selenitireducens (strain ATCC 700615 / DSM 15326 / MLS10) TaxID=439292 RepID=D6XTM8_BACIE|nr:UDP-N-acetylmuramate dehydrogenase [Salisediminibacterium selenitireducens]ADH99164.1 UDP-N-acetylenolpyruvoylglucosamine reductase [[Bacillus] selenitireducens MLS10]